MCYFVNPTKTQHIASELRPNDNNDHNLAIMAPEPLNNENAAHNNIDFDPLVGYDVVHFCMATWCLLIQIQLYILFPLIGINIPFLLRNAWLFNVFCFLAAFGLRLLLAILYLSYCTVEYIMASLINLMTGNGHYNKRLFISDKYWYDNAGRIKAHDKLECIIYLLVFLFDILFFWNQIC